MFAIAELTIRKLKEPAFIFMVLFAIFLGFCVAGLEPFVEQDQTSIIGQLISPKKGYPLLTSSFFAIGITLVMAIFTGATEIPRDIDSRMIMVYITKPIRKVDYLLGKYFGILGLCVIVFTITEITIFTVHYINSHEIYHIGIMLRQFYLLLILLPLVAITIAISCFFADLSAMILTAIYIMFSLSVSTIPLLIAILPESISKGVNSYLYTLYYLFPNFIFYFQTFKLIGLAAVSLLLYSLSVTLIFLVIAAIRIKTRDLV